MIKPTFKVLVYVFGLGLNIAIALPVALLSQDAWDEQWNDFNAWAKKFWQM